jgi:hypothetical protein
LLPSKQKKDKTMKNRYNKAFQQYVCEGDTITAEISPFTIKARIVYDPYSHIDDDDAHNTNQRVTGCDDEQQTRLLAARKAWFANDWFYCGIVLSVAIEDTAICEHAASLWGIEANYPGSDNAYLTDVANELLDEALDAAKEKALRLESILARID